MKCLLIPAMCVATVPLFAQAPLQQAQPDQPPAPTSRFNLRTVTAATPESAADALEPRIVKLETEVNLLRTALNGKGIVVARTSRLPIIVPDIQPRPGTPAWIAQLADQGMRTVLEGFVKGMEGQMAALRNTLARKGVVADADVSAATPQTAPQTDQNQQSNSKSNPIATRDLEERVITLRVQMSAVNRALAASGITLPDSPTEPK